MLHEFSGVREAIVFDIPDPVKGEAVVAVVVATDGHALDAEAIRRRHKAL